MYKEREWGDRKKMEKVGVYPVWILFVKWSYFHLSSVYSVVRQVSNFNAEET